jgi:hypothetical protein
MAATRMPGTDSAICRATPRAMKPAPTRPMRMGRPWLARWAKAVSTMIMRPPLERGLVLAHMAGPGGVFVRHMQDGGGPLNAKRAVVIAQAALGPRGVELRDLVGHGHLVHPVSKSRGQSLWAPAACGRWPRSIPRPPTGRRWASRVRRSMMQSQMAPRSQRTSLSSA